MRTFTYILSLMAVFLCGCRSNVPSTPLSFYTVSEQKIDGGRFIDTAEFPKLGYIAATPDLVITRLADVYPTEPEGVIINGKAVPTPAGRSALGIELRPDDAQKLSTLSERVIGKRLLIMLGEKPLMAPRVQAVLSTRRLILECPTQAERDSVQSELERLVR
jgi:hypothetical protein